MNEKQERIKKMVAEGKISQEEGQKLLDALKKSQGKEEKVRSEQALKTQTTKPVISPWASASFIFGFCSPFAFIMLKIFGGLFLGPLAVIFGILAIKQIKTKPNYTGLNGAIGGLILGIAITLLSLYYICFR